MLRKLKFLLIAGILVCGAAAMAADTSRPDERLRTRVTMDCAGVRVHDVIGRLSADTKVDIRAGANDSDWKVRDTPILVCARDIPLGNLLKGIADAGHLVLNSSNGDDDVLYYRLWRSSKYQRALDDFTAAQTEAELAAAKYDWDVMAKLAEVPDSELEASFSEADRAMAKHVKDTANIFALLGPEARDRVLSGEQLILTNDCAPEPVKPYVLSACRNARAALSDLFVRSGGEALQAFDDADTSRLRVQVRFYEHGFNPGGLSVQIVSQGVTMGAGPSCFVGLVRKHNPEIPARPEIPEGGFAGDKLDPGYVSLDLKPGAGPKFLDAKLKLDLPKDGKEPRYHDLLCAASKATTYTLVAEGTSARRSGNMLPTGPNVPLNSLFGREVTVREVLAFAANLQQEWFVDEQRKIILGRDKKWMERLAALVPEKLLLDIQKKLNGSGIDLDDLEPLAGLSENQFDEWIQNHPEVPEMSMLPNLEPCIGEAALGRLYFALQPSARAAAKSGKFVPVRGVDEAWLNKLLRNCVSRKMEYVLSCYPTMPTEIPISELSRLSVALNESTLTSGVRFRVVTTSAPESENKRKYSFQVCGLGRDGLEFKEDIFGAFPVTAPQTNPGSEEKATSK